LQEQWGDEWEKIWNEWLANSSWMDLLHEATWGDILRGVTSGALTDLMFVQQVDNEQLATWDVNAGELSKLGYKPERYGLYKHNGFLENYALRYDFLGGYGVEGNYELKPNWMNPGGGSALDAGRLYDPRISLHYESNPTASSLALTVVGFFGFVPKPDLGGVLKFLLGKVVAPLSLAAGLYSAFRDGLHLVPTVGSYSPMLNNQSWWCPACFSH
jgi:hypothetical protein